MQSGLTERPRIRIGEMLEWLKRHAWKACVPQKGIASSNLALSAETPYRTLCKGFFVSSVTNSVSESSLLVVLTGVKRLTYLST